MGKEDLPHSKTVRGTLGNPKTQEAIKNNEKPRSMLGDPGSLKAEQLDTNPVPGKQNDDGGNVDFASAPPSSSSPSSGSVDKASNSSTSKTIGSSNAADADSGNFDAAKEENKNFDPRAYRGQVADAQSQGKSVEGKKMEGIEWSHQQVKSGSGSGSGHAKGIASLEGDYSQKMRVTVGEGPTSEAMQQGKRPPVSGDPKGIEPARGGQNGAPLPKSKL